MPANIKLLFVGDLVGEPGCALFAKHSAELRRVHSLDLIVVNGENTAKDGRGITPQIAQALKEQGADVITTGNHVWAKRDIYSYFTDHKFLIRPANFPAGCPGSGVTVVTTPSGVSVGVLNLQGRVFMRELVACPFRAAESALTFLQSRTNCILVDMHAETSSEKIGMGHFLDGKVSAVVGTHTHVQTADERILPGGTAFITDVGFGGAVNSMIGMKTEIILKQMLTQMPAKFEVETKLPYQLCGVIITIDAESGKAVKIERLKIIDDMVQL